MTKHVRIATTENLTMADTSVRELTEVLPVILFTHPSIMRIIIHIGSSDNLQWKAGSEILKRDFSLLQEKLSCQSQHVFIPSPVPTFGKRIKSLSRLLGLNIWQTSARLAHGIKFIDNYNIFGAVKATLNLMGFIQISLGPDYLMSTYIMLLGCHKQTRMYA